MSTHIDYDQLNRAVRRQKTALTRAVIAQWNEPGMAWPDDWHRWQQALDDAYPVFEAPRLEDLEDLYE